MSENNQPFGNEEENEPEIWDEHRWEEFFRESDKRTEKYTYLFEKYMDHPDRDRIIFEEMGWTHLLEDFEEEQNEWMDDFDIDEYEEGEEWKQQTGYDPTDFESFENMPLYQKAFKFTMDAMDMADEHLIDIEDESVKEFARSLTVPPAKIAGGFGFGFEMDSLGGNIANCKRGLNAANRMLNALYEIGEKELLDRDIYLEFYARAKEVRDELAIYIVELRERFRRGIS
ncbi:hypothetical protein DYD21_11925 [Rhodohalobacter sp. SW132]|uniref:hypothetical protein n=1 Tax=Rhodohalobacter sp. SW132 TaxID=2293433 RepID=UPI000E281620|nr:hypothetical protein [Rhodohalobacter sp. SW132]REL33471.1 hypothetical protein DYD21_11925 [Rhodohalobacter sp. SW132]